MRWGDRRGSGRFVCCVAGMGFNFVGSGSSWSGFGLKLGMRLGFLVMFIFW
jgi:hypothetical protein